MEVLALLRGLHVAAMLSVLGTTAFLAWILPAAVDGRPARPVLIRLWRISGWLALASGLAWFIAQADELAGASDLASLAAALPIVADQTRYGQAMLLRGLLLLGAVMLAGPSRRRPYLGMLATGVALGLQGAVGHAGAAAGNVLLASEWLHLLAAGVWLGGLLPLWLTIARLPAANAAAVCERFTPIGLGCVLVLAGTGLTQGLALIGDLPALLGTTYGHIALIKIGLFLLALVLAAANRLWLTDRLASLFPNARGDLRLSVLAETGIGLLIVLAAAFLASTPPGIHEAPIWPLSWQFTLVTVREDAGFRTEVILGGFLIGLTAATFVASLLLKRFRVVATAVLAGVIVWRAPSFTLLTATAYPTSFQASPTGFSVTSILRGQGLYQTHCAACHGADGRGDGPRASGLRIRPADLTAQHLWDHPDGEMFWWLTHGIDAPEGGLSMPGFPDLPPDDRWALIDFIRAHNAGVTLAAGKSPGASVPAPDLPIRCATQAATQMRDLRGAPVLVVAATEATADATGTGTPVIQLDLRDDLTEAPRSGCVAATPDALPAFAILANQHPAALPGYAFLVDANGWLGVLCRANPAAIERAIVQQPAQPRGAYVHHH